MKSWVHSVLVFCLACLPMSSAHSIVNGQRASRGAWPWQVQLFLDGSFTCGGSLINESWILANAHCMINPNTLLSPFEPNRFIIRLDSVAGSEKIPSIAGIYVHKQYNPKTNENDIALIKLSTPITANPITIAPAMPKIDSGGLLAVIGWSSSTPDVLLSAKVPYVDNQTCNADPSIAEALKTGMLCAGNSNGSDNCQGTGGSSLFMLTDSGPLLVGIGTADKNCANRKYGVYTRVSSYYNWIMAIIGNSP